jgi:hypothetical protein
MNANAPVPSGFRVRPTAIEGCSPLPPKPAPRDLALREIGDERFVRGQIIVTGPALGIDVVLGTSDRLRASRLIHEIGLRPWQPEEGSALSTRDLESPVIRVYQVPEEIVEEPIERLVSQFTQARDLAGEQARGLDRDLSALVHIEPNYVIGLPPDAEIQGNPECVEGGPAGKSVAAGKNEFWRQWAFGTMGIRLIQKDGSKMVRTVSAMASGVRVGIFDTSPFPSAGGYNVEGGPFSQSTQGYHAAWQDQDLSTLQMCVSHPDLTVSPFVTGTTDICDHGLFVASLVHAVAPGCAVDLIRVLDDRGRGALDTLLYALGAYRDRAQDMGEDTLQRTVLNLSLSIYPPDGTQSFPRSQSLERLLSDLYAAGAVIVSSAGNDSVKKTTAQPAMPPAEYGHVLGVAGSNIARGRAPYSNAGDVAAPGGDDRPGCNSIFRLLGARYDGRIVGLSMNKSETSHYSYWSGTSFAAPLVSGLAALVIESFGVASGPQGVCERIKNRAIVAPDVSLGAGIVDVPNTLK